jgi:hypothetical protein
VRKGWERRARAFCRRCRRSCFGGARRIFVGVIHRWADTFRPVGCPGIPGAVVSAAATAAEKLSLSIEQPRTGLSGHARSGTKRGASVLDAADEPARKQRRASSDSSTNTPQSVGPRPLHGQFVVSGSSSERSSQSYRGPRDNSDSPGSITCRRVGDVGPVDFADGVAAVVLAGLAAPGESYDGKPTLPLSAY